MEQQDLKATELDKMTCSYELQMLKAALTYFPPQSKRLLSILIKVQELKNTVRLISSPESISSLNICSTPETPQKQGFFDIWNEIKDYGGPEQQRMFDRLNQVFQLSSMYEQMSQMASAESGASAPHTQTDRQTVRSEAAPPDPSPSETVSSETASFKAPPSEAASPELAAASLSGQSTAGRVSSPDLKADTKPDFRTCIRNSLSPENQVLFDSYSAMFHSSNTFSGKEPS